MIKGLRVKARIGEAFRVKMRRSSASISTQEANTMTDEQLHHRTNRRLQRWTRLHLHHNADGRLVVAVGKEPDSYPEDEQ